MAKLVSITVRNDARDAIRSEREQTIQKWFNQRSELIRETCTREIRRSFIRLGLDWSQVFQLEYGQVLSEHSSDDRASQKRIQLPFASREYRGGPMGLSR